jgi:hypothetical protein
MNYRNVSALALIAFALVAIPASAHHAVQAVFDQDKRITVKGEITRVEFINPHSYISLNGKTPNGKMQAWTFELAGPGSLKRSGMSRADRGGLKPGDPVTITGFPAKDGTAFGFVNEIHFPDGRVFVLDNRDPYAN